MAEFIIIGLIVTGLGLWFFARPKFDIPKTAPSDQKIYRQFEAAHSVFVNRAEVSFFSAMCRAVPDGFHVLSKVRLEDIIGVKKSIKDPEAKWKLRARVKSRHVDFLIIDAAGKPVAGIEIDGPIHESEDQFNADTLKNGLFKAADVPLIRIPAGTDSFKAAESVNDLLTQFKLGL